MARKSELGPLNQRVSILVPRRYQHPATGENQPQYLLWSKFWAEVKSIANGAGETVEAFQPAAIRVWQVRLRFHSRLIGPEAQYFMLIWNHWRMQISRAEDLYGTRKFVWLTCGVIE